MAHKATHSNEGGCYEEFYEDGPIYEKWQEESGNLEQALECGADIRFAPSGI
jgi:hypothetical protein